nr:olfactory receptor 10A3-like [Marmota flaviventris]
MKTQNQSSVVEFILLGFSDPPKLQEQIFGVFLVIYLVTLMGNAIIIAAILLDQTLHIPMYLFLQNLSVVEVSFSASIMPEMLVVLTTDRTTISFVGCFAQMYFILLFGGTECFLLGAMAYDRFAAICHPLTYPMIMNKRVFVKLVMFSWVSGVMVATVQTTWVFSFPFCGPNEINHISCETPAVLELVCADTFLFEIYAFTGTILIVLVPFFLILLSYLQIFFSILKMPSTTGRQKAFSTCASHVTLVTLFYGTASMTYLQPRSSYSSATKKVMSLVYTLLTSLLNPLIYSLRNNGMKMALVKLWRRAVVLQFDLLRSHDQVRKLSIILLHYQPSHPHPHIQFHDFFLSFLVQADQIMQNITEDAVGSILVPLPSGTSDLNKCALPCAFFPPTAPSTHSIL